jgi:hypothetical protein
MAQARYAQDKGNPMKKRIRALFHALCTLLVVALLTLLVSLLGGCGSTVPEKPPVLYGPPPIQDGGLDGGLALDGGLPSDAGCEPQTLYGPPPCTSDEACRNDYGPQWYCDFSPEFQSSCGQRISWPICVPGNVDGGQPDAGADGGCAPVVLYGPPPCTSDEECRAAHDGGDWYCDTENRVPNGCGGYYTIPACRPVSVDAGVPDAGVDGGCVPALPDYGPALCLSDEECGPGWYCDKSRAIDVGCGLLAGTCAPVDAGCPPLGDGGPVILYGPRPCP